MAKNKGLEILADELDSLFWRAPTIVRHVKQLAPNLEWHLSNIQRYEAKTSKYTIIIEANNKDLLITKPIEKYQLMIRKGKRTIMVGLYPHLENLYELIGKIYEEQRAEYKKQRAERLERSSNDTGLGIGRN